MSASGSSRGERPTISTLLIAKVDCSWVYLYSWFSTSSGSTPRLSSNTIRMPWRSDSSRMFEMSSIFFERTSCAAVWIRLVLFTW